MRDFADRELIGDQDLSVRWSALARRLEVVTRDVCALLAVYVENANGLPGRPAPQQSATSDIHTPAQSLRFFIIQARRRQHTHRGRVIFLFLNFAVLCSLMFWIGYFGAHHGYLEYQNAVGNVATAFEWLIGTLTLYVLATLIAWYWRRKLNAQGEWLDLLLNPVREHHTPISFHLYGKLFLVTWIIRQYV
jgi:hypothetical protein